MSVESQGGLLTTAGQAVPLRHVQVDGELMGGQVRVRVRQVYRNDEAQPIEAIYVFPLPSEAMLSGFRMECGGRQLEGKVQEREEAFRTYHEALMGGDGAALLDQERPNVFTASVGNLLPGEDTTIEVEYLQPLRVEEGVLRWAIPTLVAPRYIPGNGQGDRTADGWAAPTDRVPDADRITPRAGDAEYRLTMKLVIDLGSAVDVESPSHAIVVDRALEGRTVVSFAQPGVALDRDVIVLVSCPQASEAVGVRCHRVDDGPGTFALTVIPDFGEPSLQALPQRVVFVVDTSGSMQGASLEQARAALLLGLRNLREGDRFNILEFNSSFTKFAPDLVVFSQATLQKADAWVARLAATGGTEMLTPMVDAVSMAPGGVVVLMTDGEVGNEAEILSAVEAARQGTRVYAFGIGTNVSDALLGDLARRSGGAVELIYPGERIDDKVVGVFAKAIGRRVQDVKVRFEGLNVRELAPMQAAPMVESEPWMVLGRYREPGEGKAIVEGSFEGRPFRLQVPVVLESRAQRPMIAKLWARERIRDLEHAGKGSKRHEKSTKEAVIALAIAHGLTTNYTSFVVVEERTGDRIATRMPEARGVPVAHPPRGGIARLRVMAPPGTTKLWTPRDTPAIGVRAMMSEAMGLSRASFSSGWQGTPPGVRDIKAHSLRKGRPAAYAPGFAFDAEDGEHADAKFSRSALEALGEVDGIRALLQRQLASGLWDDPALGGNATTRSVRSTLAALGECLEAGLTTAHPTFGKPLAKAAEALVRAAETLGATEPKLVRRALVTAWLIATGRRKRDWILTTADSLGMAELRTTLTDADTARVYLGSLAG